jgi:CheY-like chemotaxis protein
MKKKVLIVDDEPEQIDFASTIVEETGYIALWAGNGLDGMKLVRSERPDLILLDILMPGKGGIGMYEELKGDDATKDIPVIIVTGVSRGGHFDEHMVTKNQLPAPQGYLEKPMNPDTLSSMINELLG